MKQIMLGLPAQGNLLRGWNDPAAIAPQARQLFGREWRAGLFGRLFSRALRRQGRLLRLAEAQLRHCLKSRHYEGTRAVPLSAIRGSVDRSGDFDHTFRPTRRADEPRWVRVATLMLRGTPLPPVELIRIGEVYYVVDGHHRISVARALHQSYIDSAVTVWELAD